MIHIPKVDSLAFPTHHRTHQMNLVWLMKDLANSSSSAKMIVFLTREDRFGLWYE